MKWAVYSHIGVYWDGGVRLVGVYRHWITARIACRFHVIRHPMRAASIVECKSRHPRDYYNTEPEFEKEYTPNGKVKPHVSRVM